MSTVKVQVKAFVSVAAFLLCFLVTFGALAQGEGKRISKISEEQLNKLEVQATALRDFQPIAIDPKEDELRRLYKERFNAAKEELQMQSCVYGNKKCSFGEMCETINRWTKSGLDFNRTPGDQVEFLNQVVAVAKYYEGLCDYQLNDESSCEQRARLAQATYLRASMEIQLLETQKTVSTK